MLVNCIEIVCDYEGQEHFEEVSHILITSQQKNARTLQGLGLAEGQGLWWEGPLS